MLGARVAVPLQAGLGLAWGRVQAALAAGVVGRDLLSL